MVSFFDGYFCSDFFERAERGGKEDSRSSVGHSWASAFVFWISGFFIYIRPGGVRLR